MTAPLINNDKTALICERIKKSGKAVADIEGEHLAYLASLVPNYGTIVEIGTHRGRSAMFMAAGSRRLVKIYCIDMWLDDSDDKHISISKDLRIFKKHIAALGLKKKITPIRGTSAEVAKSWNRYIDMVFFDGLHTYDAIKEYYQSWVPFVIKGGIVAIHDYQNGEWEGTSQFIDQVAAKQLTHFSTCEGIWSGRKI